MAGISTRDRFRRLCKSVLVPDPSAGILCPYITNFMELHQLGDIKPRRFKDLQLSDINSSKRVNPDDSLFNFLPDDLGDELASKCLGITCRRISLQDHHFRTDLPDLTRLSIGCVSHLRFAPFGEPN